MIRRPPRSTLDRSSAASDVYKRQVQDVGDAAAWSDVGLQVLARQPAAFHDMAEELDGCLLYTSPSHETVLDLVCRLLLEKKKQKKDKKEISKKNDSYKISSADTSTSKYTSRP